MMDPDVLLITWWIACLLALSWYPRCCGGVTPPTCEYVLTTDCAEDASQYTFSMSGLTNDGCSDCSHWNGSFTLSKTTDGSGDVLWETPADASTYCGKTSGDPLYELRRPLGLGQYYTLTANGIGVQWRLIASSWDCSNRNILSIAATGTDCSSPPSTVDLIPCKGPCSICTDGDSPGKLLVEVPVLANGTCTDCADLADNYVIDKTNDCEWTGYFPNPTTCSGPYGVWTWLEVMVTIYSSFGHDYIWCRLRFLNAAKTDGVVICAWLDELVSEPDCMAFDQFEIINVDSYIVCDPDGAPVAITAIT